MNRYIEDDDFEQVKHKDEPDSAEEEENNNDNRIDTTSKPVYPPANQAEIESFIVAIGIAYQKCGLTTQNLEYKLSRIAEHYGIEGNFYVTPTGAFYSFGPPTR